MNTDVSPVAVFSLGCLLVVLTLFPVTLLAVPFADRAERAVNMAESF
jgi:hypothetical protein